MSMLDDLLHSMSQADECPPRPSLVIPPCYVDSPAMLTILLGLQAKGLEVRVMGEVNGPAPLLNDFLKKRKP